MTAAASDLSATISADLIVTSSSTCIEKNILFKNQRSINALHLCKFIISKTGISELQQFSCKLVSLFQELITTIAEINYKSKSALREKLWNAFI